MGRPGLSQNKKFRRLSLELKSTATARGHLELMWDSAYEAGDEFLGDSLDVELAASWNGNTGFLCNLLVKTGFIDESAGIYTIHDFWHHAPAYVRKRRSRENERRSKVDPCFNYDQSLTSHKLDTDDKTAPLPHPHPHPKDTTPTPSPSVQDVGHESEKPKKRTRRTQTEKLAGYSSEVVEMVKRLKPHWPTERSDGSPVRSDDVDTCSAIAAIQVKFPDVMLADLELAAMDWLSSKPAYPNAMQFFFGTGKNGSEPPWMRGYRAILTRRESEIRQPVQVPV